MSTLSAHCICILGALLCCATERAHAVPANPAVVQLTQPDGTKIQAMARGDEYQGWIETTDGYTIVKNRTNGVFQYATKNAAGELIPSGMPVGVIRRAVAAAPGLRPLKGLRPPRNVELERFQHDWINRLRSVEFRARLAPGPVAAAPSGSRPPPAVTGVWAPRPVTGPKQLLVILVNFSDVRLQPNASSYWNDVIFNTSAPSVASFYRDNSYGKVTIVPVAHTQLGSPPGVVTVSLAQANPNYGNSFSYQAETQWVNGALAAAAQYVNFPALDTNGDGIITVDETLVYFILAGYETAAGFGLSPSVWAHRWGGQGVGVSGKSIDNWALNGEMYNASTRMKMGVVAHEMGHAMGGLPDLYDTSNTNAGLGAFSVMAVGAWGARNGEIPGQTPVGMDAWSRHYLGWSNPKYPANGDTVSFVSGLAASDSAVMLMDPVASSTEYWLVENRPPVGWDAGMFQLLGDWQGGLLIEHIDSTIGTQAANSFNQFVVGGHQGNVVVEPSTATCDLLRSTESAGCASLLFYSGNSTAFSAQSIPSPTYYSGSVSNLGVKDISGAGTAMTATVQTPVLAGQ